MSRGKIFFILFCLTFVLALVAVGVALQHHIDVAAEQDIRSANAAAAANATTQSSETQPQYYVGGHVRRPGLLALPPGTTQPTLRDALTAAGGPNTDSTANASVQLVRKVGDATQTLTIPLAELLAGRHDEPLHPGDVITVSQKIDPTTLPAHDRLLPTAPAR